VLSAPRVAHVNRPQRQLPSPLACGLALLLPLLAQCRAAADPLSADAAPNALAATISRLLENAIPPEYEKKKDWDATTEIPVLRFEGKGIRTRLTTRKRAVNHGVWKHYRLRLIDPQQNLAVQLVSLRPIAPGRIAYTLHVDAKLDAWARAKVYEYGVHIIALEMESDMRVRIAVDGELSVELRTGDEGPTFALVPLVTDARLAIDEFHLRRVSDARGPLVHELGDGVRKLVEDELNGPRLTEKLNHAIDKKRDRLTFCPAELLETHWWPWTAPPTSAAPPTPSPLP
jgi:hypothetical protein